MRDESPKLPGRQRGGQTALAALSLLLVLGGLVVLYLDYDPGGRWFGGKWQWSAYLVLDDSLLYLDIDSPQAGKLNIRLTWLGGTLLAMGLGGVLVLVLRRA